MFSNYTGYNQNCITMIASADSTINKGDLVKINPLGVIEIAGKDEAFIGVATDVRGYNVTVQTSGYVELNLDASSGVTCGPQKLVVGTAGVTKDKGTDSVNYVRTVVAVDTNKKIAGVIL